MTVQNSVYSKVPSALGGFRLVTLCGSAGSKHDATRDSQDLLEPVLRARGIDVRPVDLGDWSLPAVPPLLREIARHRPDGILMQYPTGAFGHSLGPIAFSMVQRVAPMMVMLHEFVAAHPLRKAAVGALLLRVDRIGVTAERERDRLVSYYPWLQDRIRTVPIASNIPGRHWAPVHPPRVVYFGQLRPAKGIENFIACRDRIAAKVPEAVFQIIGAVVPKLQDYADLVQREATTRGIAVISNLEIDEVADALAAATVALLPFPGGVSLRRGSLFAATASGVPIVTTIGSDTPAQLLAHVDAAHTDDDLAVLTVRYIRDDTARWDAHCRSVLLDGKVGWNHTADYYGKIFEELLTIGVARRSCPQGQTMRAPR